MDTITALKYFDPDSRITWLDISTRLPKDQYDELTRQFRWRYSRYREQFYCNHVVPQYPSWLTVVDCGEVHYAEERPDRLAARASKASAKATSAWDREHKIGDMIPFGQPILVGHHSEGRARRDASKIQSLATTAVHEMDKADHLQQKAEGSKAYQEYVHNPSVIARRIQRLEEEIRRSHNPEFTALREKELESAKAELEGLGGIPFDKLDLKKGDRIYARGYGECEVVRICKKSVSCMMLNPHWPGVWTGKRIVEPVDKTRILRKIEKIEISEEN